MNSTLTELFDYDTLRQEREATMFVVHPPRATLVLGSAQTTAILDEERVGATPLRRRRGGGGLVLVQPDDLWVDWWIPIDDPRWRADVHASSRLVGGWWAEVLKELIRGDVTVHDGPVEGEHAHRLVCFAGRGPGEVFVDDRKAVGVTQWRVREGAFVSTIMHARASDEVLSYLKAAPDGLDQALNHLTTLSLGDVGDETVIEALRVTSGPWRHRTMHLDG